MCGMVYDFSVSSFLVFLPDPLDEVSHMVECHINNDSDDKRDALIIFQ